MAETAVGYIRVSTDQQVDEGVSLAAQRDRIEAYARLTGLRLAEIVEDAGISGGIPLADRPGGRALADALRAHKGRHVIALKLDRLFRDTVDALVQTRKWDNSGVGLHLIDFGGQTINTSTAMGRMFMTMMAGFAELERSLIGERTALALALKKARLEVYSALPLGYQASDGRLIPVNDELRVIAEIRAMRAKGLSYGAIADSLNGRGIVGKRGGRFFASTIHAICRNELHGESVSRAA